MVSPNWCIEFQHYFISMKILCADNIWLQVFLSLWQGSWWRFLGRWGGKKGRTGGGLTRRPQSLRCWPPRWAAPWSLWSPACELRGRNKALRRTAAPSDPPTPTSATDPEPSCCAVDSWRSGCGGLTYEFVTHCKSYQSSPFHCQVDSPPCSCTHGTCRLVAPHSPQPPWPPPAARVSALERSRLLSTCIHWLSHRRVACEAARAPHAIPVLSALLDEIYCVLPSLPLFSERKA